MPLLLYSKLSHNAVSVKQKKRHPSTNWPEERLAAIERHTQKRVRQLLSLKLI